MWSKRGINNFHSKIPLKVLLRWPEELFFTSSSSTHFGHCSSCQPTPSSHTRPWGPWPVCHLLPTVPLLEMFLYPVLPGKVQVSHKSSVQISLLLLNPLANFQQCYSAVSDACGLLCPQPPTNLLSH